MDIGFTGSRWGMGESRIETLTYLISKLKADKARHGMCKGADTEFHGIVKSLGLFIEGHPPLKQDDFFVASECDVVHPPKDYLDRDRDIVDNSDVMFATPHTNKEQLRSGTWYTIRYAKKVIKSGKGRCKELYIIFPDGKVDYVRSEENK